MPVIAMQSPSFQHSSDIETYARADSFGQKPVAMQTTFPVAAPASTTETDTQRTSAQQPHLATDEQQRASELQIQWKEAMCRNLEIPDGYGQVAVLIIEWADHLDQLNTGPEVAKLKSLFLNRFYYEVETVSLREETAAHQLRRAMSDFLMKYDRQNNLIIVYYTGHSQFNTTTGELEFWSRDMEPAAPYVRWNLAETMLMEEVSADTLVILDTCFASNFTRGGAPSNRTYQALSACGWDRYTAAPGKRSFTTALITSLEACLEEKIPFSVWKLMDKINKIEYRRDNPAQLHDRLGTHVQHILLAPLNKDKGERDQKEKTIIKNNGVADLTLRFNLARSNFDRDIIELLTKKLPKAFKESGLELCRIDLDGLEERRPYTSIRAQTMALQWGQSLLKMARKHSEASQHQQTKSDASEAASELRMSSLAPLAEVDEHTPEWSLEETPMAVRARTKLDLQFLGIRHQHLLVTTAVTLIIVNAINAVYLFLR